MTRTQSKNKTLVGKAIAAASVLALGGMFAQATIAQEGFFSADQVARGADLYDNRCAVCHGPDIAESFGSFTGTADDLVQTIIAFGMPQDNPGGLPMQQYLDIVAYIFNMHGLPLGEEIERTSPLIKEIRIPG